MAGAKRDHFYKRDPERALRGMAGLSNEQCGAYAKLIELTYARGRPPSDDDVALARMIYTSTTKWRRLKAELVELGRIRISDGLVIDDASVEVLATRAQEREEAVENGSEGGRKSAAMREKSKSSGKKPEISGKIGEFHRASDPENKDLGQGGLNQVESELEVQLLDLDSDSFLGLDCNVDGALPPLRADSPLLAFDGPTKPDDELTDIELNRLCVGAFGRRPVESETMMLATIGHIRDAMRAGCDLRRHILPFIALRTRDGRLGVVRYWSYFPMTALLDRRNAERAHVGDEILDAHARAALRLARGKKGKVA